MRKLARFSRVCMRRIDGSGHQGTTTRITGKRLGQLCFRVDRDRGIQFRRDDVARMCGSGDAIAVESTQAAEHHAGSV